MKKPILFLFLCLMQLLSVHAQEQNGNNQSRITAASYLDDFMAKRFGMFIHWGPISLRGTEIGWSRGHGVPVEEYDNLYKEFNPVLFNADKWVQTAREAGMKYITITSKHHDGFCLWPTKFSDYNISNSPFKRDIVGELARACKKQGIKFCVYFTILDWHDKNYPVHNLGDSIPDPNANMPAFVETIKNQLTEIITQYHPYMLWFDGNWEKPWTKAYGEEVYALIKKLDPTIIVNNRLGKGTHKVLGAENVGDYATPEQEIGEINMLQPWESCITICQQWAWKPNDKMKSVKESLQTLAATAGGNGNLLFNVGPMPDGRMEERQIKMLAKMGEWLNKYGESIYGTHGGPYKPNNIYATTRKGYKIFIHLFKQSGNTLQLAPLPELQISKAYFLKGAGVSFTQNASGILLQIPTVLPDEYDAVIVLEMNKNTESIPVLIK